MGTYRSSILKGITWSVGVFLVLIPVFLSFSNANPTESSITFVQIPDVHLFDDGKPRKLNDLPSHALWQDDEKAFSWAIEEIKAIKGLNFIVFTGDLGLEMTGPYWESQAVDYFAKKLSGLPVSHILFVPGNNDLLNEEPKDIGRYQSFVTALGSELQKKESKAKVMDLSKKGIPIDGMHLHGLNSATFKNSIPCRIGFNQPPGSVVLPNDQEKKNLEKWTVIPFIPFPKLTVQYLWCQADEIAERLKHQKEEMSRLASEVQKEPKKVHLIFMHIPPLPDPFYNKNFELPTRFPSLPLPNDTKIANQVPLPWNLDGDTITTWNNMWNNPDAPEKYCMFAAHFHTDDKKYYGINGLDKGDCNGKLVVAPPLAIKFQDDVKKVPMPARGFLKGTVTQNGTINYEIVWHP